VRAVSLLQHGFVVGLCLQTAVNYLAVLSQGEPRDADDCKISIRIEFYNGIVGAVSLPQHGFLVGLCLQTAVNYLAVLSQGY